MSTKTKSSLRGIAYKRPRPKSKAEQLTARQNKLLTFNHPDYLELVNKRKIEIDGDGSVGGTLGKRKRGKKIAKKEVDELFKDLEGAEAIESDEELEDEDQQQMDEETQKMDQSDRMSSADIGDEEDEDDESPPEELFSLPKILHQIEMNEEEEHGGDRVSLSLSDKLEQIVHQKKPKLSKKRRDSLKKVQNGVYDVEMSGAKFKVMALSAKARVADEEIAAAYSDEWDEGTLMREPSHPGELQKPQTTFREQLLQMAGSGKERAKRCSWKNGRWRH